MTPEIEATDINTSPARLEELAKLSLELARLVAKNIAAPGELLTKLHKKNAQQINKALVVNPNTPSEILMKLGVSYPKELLTNAVWDLLLLSHPNFFTEMPAATLGSLLTIDEFKQKWGVFIFSHREDKEFFSLVLTKHINLWNQGRKENPIKKILLNYYLDLSHNNLESTNLSAVNLERANLSGANLRWANLESAHLRRTNLEGADLRGANLRNAFLFGARFREAKIDSSTKIPDEFRLVWKIVNQTAAREYLSKAYLCEAYLKEASLEKANLSEANLAGSNLEEANLEGANLEGANLSGANLCGANLKGAYLIGANLSGVNLEGAELKDANLCRAFLKKANLKNANLSCAYLNEAELKSADLKKTNLLGASLDKAILVGANLSGAKIDRTTIIDRKWLKNHNI